ncbi:MAG: hypothetical protein LIO51_01640 [Clostridiales bacterium]|nr:hypothetical protein [Clostridiales bacterium]
MMCLSGSWIRCGHTKNGVDKKRGLAGDPGAIQNDGCSQPTSSQDDQISAISCLLPAFFCIDGIILGIIVISMLGAATGILA